MRDCGEGCEIRTGADRPPPIARSHLDAMKEFQLSGVNYSFPSGILFVVGREF
jgi:hypothetical protein